MLDQIVKIITDLLGQYRYPPLSSISVLLVSILVGLITIAANYLLLDVKKLREYSREIMEWRREMQEALMKNDRKTIVKLKKREAYISKLNAELMSQRMKPSLIFMIPLWFFFIIFAAAYNTEVGYVIKMPFSIPFAGDKLNFGTWYIICSLLVFPILQKIFKLSY
ncbi:MAG: EMC3/TMCO1 family protein [archaeon GB-1867-097]|nr:DUF106 domain-containing protein [Candidatus Verstraetearchaeota archaeon]MCS7374519.1 EMC3/TMCO1 family protein [Candidatus Culexmicrobium thermophilum]MCS7384982.1 EMC3/TMCO1 family protein [Candidatus Culexmicrobium thermophilum]RLE57002.1 MAG: hypothetical protein DRJ30_01015 [Candidatus Verstraetearchaeota archaeon]HDO20579.1 DUF106 domain-containing protein [Candidatus Bathyarchaeota archaeon]